MKFYVLVLMLSIVACSKTEFKENKVAVSQPMSTDTASVTESGTAPALTAADVSKELPAGHPPVEGSAQKEIVVPKMEKAAGGYTIEELFNGKATLAGKKVTVRGKVVKFNAGIMKRNWIHIKDGTGKAGTDDLTVTTNDVARLNDTVTITGTVRYDKDVGSGYFFPTMIEDASVKVEK